MGLIETVHDWITGSYNKTQIDAILLDFAKAFDQVPHKRLLSGVFGVIAVWRVSLWRVAV